MSKRKKYDTLRLILGDQLNAGHSWFSQKDPRILYVIAELHQEQHYVRHHGQKICAFFMAMEHFATALKQSGHHVLHLTLDDTEPYPTLSGLLTHLCVKHGVKHCQYQQPDEYRLREQLQQLQLPANVTKTEVDGEHFLLPFNEIDQYFEPGKHKKMEFFYRAMRRRFDILLSANEPVGGQWNYDADNRKKLKPGDLAQIAEPLLFAHPTKPVKERLQRHQIPHFGHTPEQLPWPLSRKEANTLLEYFCQHCLPHFGTFQDAMTCNSEFQWSLYHSRLSFALNTKMLHPMHVITTAIRHYQDPNNGISIAQIEGFVRQILGWREYVRGVYWANMPEYSQANSLGAKRQLPNYFWTGDTHMRCMSAAIGQSLHYSYAHHIQRLMITGNFCLLTGIEPAQVDEWYLGVYIDAIEWVELPNTRGMSQFADNGIVATKPYVAGGNYINKMSDYCKSCHYDVKDKVGDSACPFNSLYWHFLEENRAQFSKNHRMSMVYRAWEKQDAALRTKTLQRAQTLLETIETL